MNKQEYKKRLEELNFDKERFCIMSGGAMVFHDIREQTNDVDLKIMPEYFEELSKKYDIKPSPKNYEDLYVFADDVELKVANFSEDEVEIIDGYMVRKLEKELEWKLEYNRPKDKEDIRKIKERLKSL